MPFRQTARHTLRRAPYITAGLLLCANLMLPAAVAGSEVVTDSAPPPLQVEHQPPPRDGYVWSAGHWEWNGRSYVWASGIWILERRAAHWVDARWEQADAHWHYVPGHWER